MNLVVTGGTKGIGKAIVELFLDKGRNVATCSRNQSDLDRLHAEWSRTYPDQEILVYRADLGNKEQTEEFAAFVLSQWDRVDILINNAGLFVPGEILKEEPGTLEKSMDINVYSAYYLTRAVVPRMIKAGRGHIFNICSIASLMAYPNGGSYTVSKFALLGFSKVIREELKKEGIKVTSVLPGHTWSASWNIDLPEDRLMQAKDIALAIWNATILSPSAVVEEIIIRPQLGDL